MGKFAGGSRGERCGVMNSKNIFYMFSGDSSFGWAKDRGHTIEVSVVAVAVAVAVVLSVVAVLPLPAKPCTTPGSPMKTPSPPEKPCSCQRVLDPARQEADREAPRHQLDRRLELRPVIVSVELMEYI